MKHESHLWQNLSQRTTFAQESQRQEAQISTGCNQKIHQNCGNHDQCKKRTGTKQDQFFKIRETIRK